MRITFVKPNMQLVPWEGDICPQVGNVVTLPDEEPYLVRNVGFILPQDDMTLQIICYLRNG